MYCCVVRDHGDSLDTANVVEISEADSIVDDSSVVVVKTGQAYIVGVVVVEPFSGKRNNINVKLLL